MVLSAEQRALAKLISYIADVDLRTASRAVLFGPENMRSARVREACGAAMRELKAAALQLPSTDG